MSPLSTPAEAGETAVAAAAAAADAAVCLTVARNRSCPSERWPVADV